MNRFVLLTSLALVISASAGFSQDKQARLIVAPLHGYSELDRTARDRLEAVSRPGGSPAAVIDSIRAVEEPPAREAQWNAWLDSLNAVKLLAPVQLQALEDLADHSPVLGIPHHEFPTRTVPAYQVADRARVLLARNAARRRAGHLAGSPQALALALEAPPESREFSDGLLALEQASDQTLSSVVAGNLQTVSLRPATAGVLLRAVQIDPAYEYLLPQVIAHGDTETARRAIRFGLARRAEVMPEIALEALARPELGGLALQAARQAGMEADTFCWDLLDDASLGADAARLLAADSEKLIEEIRRRIGSASSTARVRMLLALKFRSSQEARALLTELVEAPWLSDQQKREVRAWP